MVFLIIFGTRGVTYSVATGEFHCPSCAIKRGYDHKRVRRFFTLYFIPLIPLDTFFSGASWSGVRRPRAARSRFEVLMLMISVPS